MVTGQNDLNYLQNKVHKLEFLCRFCEADEETFDHLFFDCPCFILQRRELLVHNNLAGTHTWTIKTVQ